MLLRCGVYIADMLKAAGFIDVKFEQVAVKLGKWAGEDSVQGRDTTIGAWRGMRRFCDENGRNGSVRVG